MWIEIDKQLVNTDAIRRVRFTPGIYGGHYERRPATIEWTDGTHTSVSARPSDFDSEPAQVIIPARPGWRVVIVTTETLDQQTADTTTREVIAWRGELNEWNPVSFRGTPDDEDFFAVISPIGRVIAWDNTEHADIKDFVAYAAEGLLARNVEYLAERKADVAELEAA